MSQDLSNALNNLTDELKRHRRTYDASYGGEGDISGEASSVSADAHDDFGSETHDSHDYTEDHTIECTPDYHDMDCSDMHTAEADYDHDCACDDEAGDGGDD